MPIAEAKPVSLSWIRLDGVDILRGVAIFLVLMNHVNMRLFIAKIPYTQGLPPQLTSSLVWSGQYGVQIFFAVSGFLITSTTIRRWGSLDRINVVDFYALRFARIAPLLLVLLTVLCALHLAGLGDFVVPDKTGGLAGALFAALTFHVNLLEAQRGYLPGNWDILWSLSVEEVFYLLFPLVCWWLGCRKWFIGLLVVFVVLGPAGRTALAHGNEVWKEYSYLGGMDAIALGSLTAIGTARTRLPRLTIQLLGCIGTVLLLCILGLSRRIKAWGVDQCGLDMSILAVGTCMLIAVVSQTRWQAQRFTYPVRMLGQYSYEIYLTHMFVVFALFDLFKASGRDLRFVPALFLAVIFGSALLGQLIARFYSEPINRLLRRRFGDSPDRLGSVLASDATQAGPP